MRTRDHIDAAGLLAFPRRRHAVVVGGSLAGMLAARVLSDHFDDVSLLERDRFPETPTARKGLPQGRHAHGLLERGRGVMERFLPGLTGELVQAGAEPLDWTRDVAWMSPYGWYVRFPGELLVLTSTRDLIDWGVRRRVAALPNVRTHQGADVAGLILGPGGGARVAGVRLRSRAADAEVDRGGSELAADLVVVADGRNSHLPEWLTALGYEPPEETVVNCFLGYASRFYRPPAEFEPDWKGLYIQQAPPAEPRGGLVIPVEGGRWLVSLIGGDGDYPPTDEAGFLAFARSLRSPALYEAIAGAEPFTPIAGHRKTENRLRHYDRLGRFPDGVVAVGDAACAFNPVYAQGMTAAALGAEVLDRWLREGSSHRGPGRGRDFQRRLARATASAWRLSAGADYRFRAVEGPPQGRVARLTGCYIAGVMRGATRQPWVRRRLEEVLHLLRPPSALFGPGVLARLAWDRLAGQADAGDRRVWPFPERADRSSRPSRRSAADFNISKMGLAILLFAGLSQFQHILSQTARARDERGAAAIAPGLVTAIRDADAQAVRKLLENGAGLTARDAEGNTPLILASFYASPKCVALLLEKGADANAANKAGVTALVSAATNYEKTRLLVQAGANVRVRTADLGNTPLVLAARRAGNSRTVKLLLERGAGAAERNNAGISPIISGAASGDLKTVQLLLAAGAKADDFPESQDPRATDIATGLRTPLMWAAYRNDVPMVRLLLEHGADPNQSTYFGSSLSQACWNDGFEAAELLIDHGANVSARDAVANFTPLHWAAGNETLRPHLVKLLLGSGALPNAAGGEPVAAFGLVPQTPRLIAEKRGRTAIVDALVAAGAKDEPPRGKIATPKRALPEELDRSTIITSAEKALAALQSTAAKSRAAFLRHVSKQDCVSCHQQYLPMAAVGHARNRSIRFDQDAAREQIDLLVNLEGTFPKQEFIAQTLFHPDPAHTFGYELLGLAAEAVPSSAKTDGMVHHLVTIQALDGRWMNNIPRPPMMSNDVTATALAVHAINYYAWQGRAAEFAASVNHARQWLWTVDAETNEEMIFQLLGLRWAGESVQKLTCLAGSLRQKQRSDGGWAQLATLESDAYATGEALYALAQFLKDPMTDPAWQRGLRFLLETQEDDGTWHVARRAFPFQPTMKSGFPHHRDSWISAAGTSWAVMALTQVAPVGSASGKPATAQQTIPVRTPKHEQKIDFARQVKPLLERSCVACHSGEKPRGLFRIDGRDGILKGGASGEAAIVPGHNEKSQLIDYVSGTVPDSEMPPKAQRKRFPALKTDEVALLRAWIDQGAE